MDSERAKAAPREVVVTFARVWALGSGVVLLALSGLGLAMAVASDSAAGMIGFSAMAVVFGVAAVRQLWLLVSPHVLFEATPEGITTYLDGQRYKRPGFLVPWSEVVSLEKMVRHEQGNRRLVTIAVHVRPSHPVPSHVSYGPGKDEGVLHLDASTGSLRGDALLNALKEVRRGLTQ